MMSRRRIEHGVGCRNCESCTLSALSRWRKVNRAHAPNSGIACVSPCRKALAKSKSCAPRLIGSSPAASRPGSRRKRDRRERAADQRTNQHRRHATNHSWAGDGPVRRRGDVFDRRAAGIPVCVRQPLRHCATAHIHCHVPFRRTSASMCRYRHPSSMQRSSRCLRGGAMMLPWSRCFPARSSGRPFRSSRRSRAGQHQCIGGRDGGAPAHGLSGMHHHRRLDGASLLGDRGLVATAAAAGAGSPPCRPRQCSPCHRRSAIGASLGMVVFLRTDARN